MLSLKDPPNVINGAEEFERVKDDVFRTGCQKFDDLFAPEQVANGNVIEIFGLPLTGKTMLLYTIMLNILEQTEDFEIVFIDTKRGFEPLKLTHMMIARGVTEKKRHEILKKIYVHRSPTAEEVIAVLRFYVETPQQHQKVKIIIIDSITAVWYLYLGHTLFRMKLMEETMRLVRELNDQNITVLVTNIALHNEISSLQKASSSKSTPTDDESSSYDSPIANTEPSFEVHPALGQYWEKFADYKVLVNFNDNPHKFDADLEKISREISLYSAKILGATSPIHIEITDAGVV